MGNGLSTSRYIRGVAAPRLVRKLSRVISTRLGLTPSQSGTNEPVVRGSSFPFISGDTFRSVAEVILEPEQTTIQHGLNTGVIFADGRLAVSGGFSDQVGRATEILDQPDNATLVIHNHDNVPDETQFAEAIQVVNRVFSGNVPDGIHGVTPVPLGLENAFRRKNGRLNYYLDALEHPTPLNERTETVVSNFHTSTNPLVREATRDILRESRHGHYDQFFKSLEYRQLIRRTKFVISPPGNGNDCHRTWEALYLGAVPVVLHDFLAPSLTSDLPILAVDSYEAFCELSDGELDDIYSSLRTRPLTKAWAHYWITQILDPH